MVSYIKTQWFRLLLCVVCLGLAIFFALQPAGDESTIEGLNENLGNMFASVCWLISSLIWGIMSFVNWHDDRLTLLEKKAEKYDAICELVEALREANEIDRERDEAQDQKLRILFEVVHTLKREATK